MAFRNFDSELAEKFGVNNAVLIGDVYKWIEFYKSNYINFGFGSDETCKYESKRYWVFSSISAIKSTLCYLSEKDIFDVCKDCAKKDLIRMQKLYNPKSGDWDGNKIWVAFGDSVSEYYDLNKYVRREKAKNHDRFGGNKSFVKERDKNRCSICGSAEHIVVHHIDGYDPEKPENNKDNKLIVLCRNCHYKVHAKSAEKKIIIPKDQLDRIGYFD